MSLGSLRYDKYFDYTKRLKDDRAKAVVTKYYNRLMVNVQDRITKRNLQRVKAGVLTYPYFLPEWMPNSIHT